MCCCNGNVIPLWDFARQSLLDNINVCSSLTILMKFQRSCRTRILNAFLLGILVYCGKKLLELAVSNYYEDNML